ncbi:hypothetical protein [Nocardioides marmoribigeumensis]|uniref:Uncharacterized protein n=1 Tax=Nocardioides marmoribigeumensis TaxID=433649 RepID=A0ABU2BW57_9ACTN|nr:hypothetical protein [Nocardioides marmoribigeumensis]MDR7362850.1 hypothetical protein [Nocardioides marmoribigeumensis]
MMVVGSAGRLDVDVNGNGTPNKVGLVRRGDTQNGSWTVRVSVGSRVVTATRKTAGWYGSPWQGAANVDGRPGKELFLGVMAGAHTQFFAALAYQGGKLVERHAPSPRGGVWTIDGAYAIEYGWWRRQDEPPGVVRLKRADRNDDCRTFDARISTFRWTSDGWVRKSTKRYPHASQDFVSGWGGFHIRGLQRY